MIADGFGVCRTTERRDDVLKRVNNVDVTSCDDMTFSLRYVAFSLFFVSRNLYLVE